MIEVQGNIWEQHCDWLCITTNGIIRQDGKAVMGRGIALQAKQRCPNIDSILAKQIKTHGNVVAPLLKLNNKWILSFPTKHHWKNPSDLKLIKQSAKQLKQYFDKAKKKPIILLPRPGCANGGLNWQEVKKILEPILTDDNFIVINL